MKLAFLILLFSIPAFAGCGFQPGIGKCGGFSKPKSSPAPPYNPATDPNFVADWESTTGITSLAGIVSNWTDQVASIGAAGTAPNQPNIVANQLNGNSIIRFTNAVAFQALLPTSTAHLISGTAPWEIDMVVRPTSAGVATYGGIFGFTFPAASGSSNGMLIFSSSPVGGGSYGPGPFWGGTPGGAGGWPNDGGYTESAFTYNTTTFDVWSIRYNGTGLGTTANFGFFQNNNSITVQAITTNSLFDPSANAIGDYDVSGANSFNGDIAALYITNAVLSGGERTIFNTYLDTKWGFSF